MEEGELRGRVLRLRHRQLSRKLFKLLGERFFFSKEMEI